MTSIILDRWFSTDTNLHQLIHAALFAEKISLRDWKTSWVIAFWMLLFLGGAFISSVIIGKLENR